MLGINFIFNHFLHLKTLTPLKNCERCHHRQYPMVCPKSWYHSRKMYLYAFPTLRKGQLTQFPRTLNLRVWEGVLTGPNTLGSFWDNQN